MISWLAKIVFIRLMGWTIEGEFPQIKKFIVAVFPHTRNMDFIVGVMTRAILDEKISYVGKKELFNPFTAWFFKALGGTPINRSSSENNVSSIAQIFKENEVFRMAIAPEGTRKRVVHWKTGFYYIAMEVKAPILLVNFNYLKKKVSFLNLFHPTGDIEKDFKEMKACFVKAMQP